MACILFLLSVRKRWLGAFKKLLVKCHNKVISNWPLIALLLLLLTKNFFSYFKRPNFFAQDKEEEAEAGPVEVVIVVEGRSSEQTSSSQTNSGYSTSAIET